MKRLLWVLVVLPPALRAQGSAVNLGNGNSVYEVWAVNTSGGTIAANTLV